MRWLGGGEGVICAESRASGGDARGTVTVLSCEGAPPALTTPRWSALTDRERDVTRLVAMGRTDAEIAHELSLSVHTVKQYLKSVYRTVGVRSRVELARRVLTEGSFPAA